ncbi:Putative F0F1-ATPase subunit Ca2+/Mg2+ transporter [Lishizhenia tianjinensis]|uniref:Putative F0F1-ATPase subunit Ca2+/Mg2+ transporter n=1 Tax=Lishizhenia tianjinensis TaxID=477690 RepID=A0A1I7AXN8_9FLAO|nr:AtpZ/AtpI family protein [Lishizhenia tianjinensis]SFT79672.1 Putative F0F1-ATPase subunit Ca2+/Mg2+ transporter [Lishizhenia tianjinensis]
MDLLPKNKGNYSKFIRFTGLGLQMGVSIWLGSLIGEWLDKKYPSEHISYYKVVTLFVVFGSIYSIIRQVIKLSNQDDEE